MLDFAKSILIRVSFDENLFLKELRKLIIWSNNENIDELKDWCKYTFGHQYGESIETTFSNCISK